MKEKNSATYEGNFEAIDQSVNLIYDEEKKEFFVVIKNPKLEIEFPSREDLLDFTIKCASLGLIHKNLPLKLIDVDFDKDFAESLEEKYESLKKENPESP